MNQAITLNNVSFSYSKDKKVINDFNFSVSEGAFLGVTGTNGSGKSTFSYLLNGLIPHHLKGSLTGEIHIYGESTKKNGIAYFAKKVGMVFQNPDFSLFNLTVDEEIAFGLKNLGFVDIEKRIINALKLVNLDGYGEKDPQTLSIGEKQKVALASVLALDTPIIVLDEPTAQLDFKSSLDLYSVLSRLNKTGKTIVTIEHDTDFLMKYTNTTLIINKGSVVSFGLTKKVLKNKFLLNKLGIKVPYFS